LKKSIWLLLLAACTAVAQPVDHFFRHPAYSYMTLSPDGTSIAALAPVVGRQNVVVIDVKTRQAKPITGERTRDIVEVHWVNSNRLVVRTGTLSTAAFESKGGALYSINKDGSNTRMLAEGGSDEQMGGGFRVTARAMQIVRTMPGESNDIIGLEHVFSPGAASRTGQLFRVDTTTSRRTELSGGKPDSGESESWVVDNRGVPRALVTYSGGRLRIYYRAGVDAPWRKLDEYAYTSPGWAPLAVSDDGKSLIVSDQRTRDKAAIVRYDPETKSFGDVLAAHPQVDLRDLLYSEGRAVGVRFNADRIGQAWFDDDLARIQRGVDAAFPDKVNLLSWSRDRSLVLVTSFGDTTPGSFYLFDTKARKMEWLLDRAPWIKPEELAPMRPVRYTARDGLVIPAYLTLPKGREKNAPLVVMVHGGPWVDGDTWGYHPEVQFLASRGYAVLQPNFRGTTRYGWKHFASSFGQWGLAMQDDVTDGVKWAVAEGIADPARVCIYGASYGGYAAMMALAKEPGLFRCGVNYVGVTDLDFFLTASWADYAYSDFIQFSVKDMVGDARKDAERIRTTSPVNLAARIKAPVLMAYGGVDFRVPIEHGTRMRSALERHGGKPVWIVAEDEAHGFQDPKNQKIFYEAMEKFLRESLGAP
jgi:dipeptidyl aminopeptidase/acylaminoacyl peptidase